MRTKIIIITISVCAFVAAAAGLAIWAKKWLDTPEASSPSPATSGSPEPTKQPEPLQSVALDDIYNDAEATPALKAALNPDVGVTETGVIGMMHHMTHQKVVASDKWQSIELTKDRSDLLVQVIEKKGRDWNKRGELLRIAKRWTEGDFSEIDKEHNYFWSEQEGNVGKATGIATPEQEKVFIQEHFRK